MTAAREELVIGHTALGRPIEAVRFAPADYARARERAILFGAIHGDEPASRLVLERLADELVERPPGRETWIIPCLNVDGTLAGTKNSANDVDLNRHFAATNWTATHAAGYFPGLVPETEREVRALVDLIARTGATRLVAVHATYRCFNWDGRGRALAEEMAALAPGYPATGDLGYPTPGSFGSKYGVDRGLEVVTVEVPYLVEDEQAWTDIRAAMRWTVDLPT